jgi:NAD+ synthase (glutamine-hydrolysing)
MAIRLYLAQINPVVGDISGNYELIVSHIKKARKEEADITIFPELALTGYPPEDLLLKNAFIRENMKYLDKIKEEVHGTAAIVGFAHKKDSAIFNSAAVMCGKDICYIYNKQRLPNYSVFDEERYFNRGDKNYIFNINGHPVGLNICEDIFYASGPTKAQSIAGGAELVINISASPYHIGKVETREKMVATRATDNIVNIVYLNMVGGQDELVFDGNSIVVNEKGKVIARCLPFAEDSMVFDIDPSTAAAARLKDTRFKNQKSLINENFAPIEKVDLPTGMDNKKKEPAKAQTPLKYSDIISCKEEEILKVLTLGTRDYIKKNGFKKVVVALSGGIDSAITSVIATLAIGKDNVNTVFMPSDFSSTESRRDSRELAKNLGIKHDVIPIAGIFGKYLEELDSIFAGDEINVTKENIQARIRGSIIMAFSNEHGWLVLSTGNKSEISVGYCTLYGDMVGGFSPIKDVYKTMVYSICRFINKKHDNIIPENIITRAPSAELKPDQTDQDRLPPYDILDQILNAYIEQDRGYKSIVEMGFDKAMVTDVLNMVDNNEYKRRQGSPGVKITARAFGKDRRYPITNKFRINN